MSDQLLRTLIDIEIISGIVIASSLLIAASIEDVRTRQAQLSLPLADQPLNALSLKSIYKDYESVISNQAKSARDFAKIIMPKYAYRFIEGFALLVALAAPVVLVYITYEAIRFHAGFLTAVVWMSLCGFALLATLANRQLAGWRKLRLVMLDPVIYWPFVLFSVFWSLKITKNALKSGGAYFMEAKVWPE